MQLCRKAIATLLGIFILCGSIFVWTPTVAGADGLTLVPPVPGSDVVIGILTGSMVKDMEQQHAVVEIVTDVPATNQRVHLPGFAQWTACFAVRQGTAATVGNVAKLIAAEQALATLEGDADAVADFGTPSESCFQRRRPRNSRFPLQTVLRA